AGEFRSIKGRGRRVLQGGVQVVVLLDQAQGVRDVLVGLYLDVPAVLFFHVPVARGGDQDPDPFARAARPGAQVLPGAQGRVVRAGQELEPVHVVGEGRRGLGFAFGAPFVAVEHYVDVAALEPVRQLVPRPRPEL